MTDTSRVAKAQKHSSRQTEEDGKVLKTLEALKELLENVFILEASKVKIPKEEIRKILRINKNRIGRISKHLKD